MLVSVTLLCLASETPRFSQAQPPTPDAPAPTTSAQVAAQPPACGSDAEMRSVTARGLAALRQEFPTLRQFLRSCEARIRCSAAAPEVDEGDPAALSAPPGECRVVLAAAEWGYGMRVIPRAANGAPAELSVGVSTEDGSTGRPRASDNLWASARGVHLVGRTTHARHTHGGESARLGHAVFRAWNGTSRPLPVAAARGEFLADGHSRALDNLRLSVATLPPGESEFEATFEAQSAYQSWDNHFSARVQLVVGGQRLVPQAAYRVVRVTPLRPTY